MPRDALLHLLWADDLTDLTPIALLDPNDFYSFIYPHWWLGDDSGLQQVSHLTGLRELITSSERTMDITEADAVCLRQLTNLTFLAMHLYSIEPGALRHIGAMDSLRDLSLGEVKLFDDGLAALSGFTELQSLEIDGTGITDNGLDCLRDMTHLRHLDIRGNQITGKGLAKITDLAELEELSLSWLATLRDSDSSSDHCRN